MSRRRLMLVAIGLVFAGALASAALVLAGLAPGAALSAMMAGAVGDRARVAVTLLRATPVIRLPLMTPE